VANTRSARKRIRSNERKRLRNRAVRSSVRTKVAKARRLLLGTDAGPNPEEDLRVAIRALDRAAEKGILHKNNARRRKSRLARMAAHLAKTAGGTEDEQAAARSAAVGGVKGRSAKPAARKPAKVAPKSAAKSPAKSPAPKASAAKPTTRARRTTSS
jgi:small subunit ribosomal protein S20